MIRVARDFDDRSELLVVGDDLWTHAVPSVTAVPAAHGITFELPAVASSRRVARAVLASARARSAPFEPSNEIPSPREESDLVASGFIRST
jgi:hypothetical protein